MTSRDKLDAWLEQSARVLDMVTNPMFPASPICWGGPGTCITVGEPPLGLCATHRTQILGPDEDPEPA